MHTLFGKIFTWYLLSALVIMVAVSATVIIVRNNLDSSRFRTVSPEALSDFPLKLIRALEENRTQDVARIEANRKSQATPRYIFDQHGNELFGRPAPSPVSQLFQKTRSSREIEILTLPLSAYIGKYFVGDGGKGYVLIYALRVRPLQSFGRLGAGWMFVTLLLVLIVILCWWLTRQLTAPILAIGAASSRLSEGDLRARIESQRFLSGDDELVRLARNFNFMAERMEGLVTAQRRWIADAAHELGSPLTRLRLALGIARQRTPAVILPYLNRIEDETDRLHGIIHQLLTLAQMDGLPQLAATELIDLLDLLSGIVNDCDFEAQACCRHVKLDPSEDCSVLGTRELLRSAIENVVRNGVRYTSPYTDVRVSLRLDRDARKVLIAVRDHGPGVPEEALKPIFEPFYRVRDRSEPDSGGTGLGLAITSRAAAAHRGTVVAANALGGGLEVTIELPVADAAQQAAYV